jgi:hypothetical protein
MKNVVITPEGKSVKANHPAAGEKVFSIRWLGGETEHFLAGDQTDAYTDEHGTTYGRSIKGSWIPVGKEGRDWEWVRYNPPKCNPPRDFGEEEAFRAAEGGYEPVPSFKAVWNDEDQDGFVFGEEFDADEHRDRQGRTTYYGWPGGSAYPVEIERSSFKMGKIKKNGRHSVSTPDRWYVVYRDTGELRGPMRHTTAKRISNKANLEEGRDSSAASEMIVKRDYSHAYYRPANAKPNGFKHARPFGGSVGREQYHVHFEDAKGIIYYYAGNTDRGVKLEREYGKAKKFTAAKAAQLAKRLDRLYKNVRHDGGHFYAESASDVKANGERGRYTTYAAWRAACRKIDRNFRVEGDKDIAQAFTADGRWIGEWDGAEGVVRKTMV